MQYHIFKSIFIDIFELTWLLLFKACGNYLLDTLAEQLNNCNCKLITHSWLT